MSKRTNLDTIWSTLKEIDTRALREQTRARFHVAILGSDVRAVQWLADALRTDPHRNTLVSLPQTIQLYILPISAAATRQAARAELAIIVLGSGQKDVSLERSVHAQLRQLAPHQPLIVTHALGHESLDSLLARRGGWSGAEEVLVDPLLVDPLETEFLPALLSLFSDRLVALGYHLPGVRKAIAEQLIKETSVANAGYAASTGVAELLPLLFIPANVADIIILTKNQALLIYKLALAMGRDINVQELAMELTGVLGSGFLWREVARRLVGFIPGFGIAPKIAIAYAGTYVIGHIAYYWFAYGKHLTPEQIRRLYLQALTEGKERAAALLPRSRPSGFRRPAFSRPHLPRPSFRRQKHRCPNCQHKLPKGAYFCSHCGFSLADLESSPFLAEETPPGGQEKDEATNNLSPLDTKDEP